MSKDIIAYNPLDKNNLGESVAEAMLKQTIVPLADIPKFKGAGIYAIYYNGDLPCYSKLTAVKDDQGMPLVPIYVGKAVPPGARKGQFGLESYPGTALYNRLNEHAKSIAQAQNLNLDYFLCRYLVVDDIWIPLGESLLVARFSPLWNRLVDGFGNHDPGSGRYEQLRSRWDVLHSGRPWAEKCRDREEDFRQIADEVVAYLRTAHL